MPVLTCPVCSRSFDGVNGQLTCSNYDCRIARMRNLQPKPCFRPRPMTCRVCGKPFDAEASNQKMCSKECRSEHYKGQYVAKRDASGRKEARGRLINCGVCGRECTTNTGNQKYCSDDCRVQAQQMKMAEWLDHKRLERESRLSPPEREAEPMQAPVKAETRRIPRHYYIYGWYFADEMTLPFYVGQGWGNRAWEVHKINGTERAFCEGFRDRKTKIVVYRDNMTKEGALLAESVLLAFFEKMGLPMTNRADGMKRKDRTPLEY